MAKGFLHAAARISRTGIYEYHASEVPGTPLGTPPNAIVRVYRDAVDVFEPESLKSFEYLPITIKHPGEVTADNVRDHVHGVTKAPVVADGDHAKVGVVLMSKDAVSRFRDGKRQVSLGYQAGIVWMGGKTEDGKPYDAKQIKIRGNHLALVDRGRAGSAELVTDEEIQNMDELKKKIAELEAKLADMATKLADSMTERDTLAGKLAAVPTEDTIKKQIEDAVTADRAARAEFAKVVATAKLHAPDIEIKDEMTARDVMIIALKARLADFNAEGKPDAYVQAAFDMLPTEKKTTPAKAQGFTDSVPTASGLRAALN